MGLDIYLYRNTDLAKHRRMLDEHDIKSNECWERVQKGRNYEDLSDDEKDDARRLIKLMEEEIGMPNGETGMEEEVRIDHNKYPDHYFKIGYFRSSYNEGGINRILENNGMPDLYDIFGRTNQDDYYFSPDWNASLARAKSVLSALEKLKDRTWTVQRIQQNSFLDPRIHSEHDAVIAFEAELENKKKYPINEGEQYWYGSKNGEFFLGKPPKVLAAIPGTNDFLGRKEPCTYLIIDTGESQIKWYYEAIEIVIATIEYVLAQPDRENYYFHWSS